MMIFKRKSMPWIVLMTIVLLYLTIIPQMVRADGAPVEATPVGDTEIINDVTQHDYQITSGGIYVFSGNNPDASIIVNSHEDKKVIIRLNDATLDVIRINSSRTCLETVEVASSCVNRINVEKDASLNIEDEEFILDNAVIDNRGIVDLKGKNIILRGITNRYKLFIMNTKSEPNVTVETFSNDQYVTNNGKLSINNSASNVGQLTNNGTVKLVGSFNNRGRFHNEAGATLENSGTLTNTDTVTNTGTIHNDGTFDNSNGNYTENGTLDNTGIWVMLAESGDAQNDLSKYSYAIKDNESYTFVGGNTGNHFIRIEKDAWPRLNLADVTSMGEIVVEDNADVRITTANSGTTITANEGEPGVKLGEDAKFNHLGGVLTINGGGDTEILNQQGKSVPVYDIAGWNDSVKVQEGQVVVKNATLNALMSLGEEKSVLYGNRTLSGTLAHLIHVTEGAELTISPKGVYVVGVDGGTVDGTIHNLGTIKVHNGTLRLSNTGTLINHGLIQKGLGISESESSWIPGHLLVEGSLTNEADGVIRNNGSNITIRPNSSFTNQGTIYTEGGTIQQEEKDASISVDLIPTLGGHVYLYNLKDGTYTLDFGTDGLPNLTNIFIGGHLCNVSELFPNYKIYKNSTIEIPTENYTLDYTVKSVSETDRGEHESLLNVVAKGQNHAYGDLSKEISVPMTIEPIQSEQSVILAPNMQYLIGKNSDGSGWSIRGTEKNGVAITDTSVYSPDTPFYVAKHCNLTFAEVKR